MNHQPTPRTDDQSVRYYDDATGTRIEYVASRFARQLEREIAEARVKLEAAQYSGIHSCHANCQRPICVLRRERDELAACLASEKITRNHIIERAAETERERDEMTLRWERTNDALFNERALADRLANALKAIGWGDAPASCGEAFKAWKEARK
jgi:hypothetical protein